jgi:hypothetical protein
VTLTNLFLGLVLVGLLVLLVGTRIKLAAVRLSHAATPPADLRELAAEYAGVTVDQLDRIEALYAADRDLPPCDRPVYTPLVLAKSFGDLVRSRQAADLGIRCTLSQGHAGGCACVHGHRGA